MRVLVLCHGNVNRSPFAAALIAHHRPSWEVSSAGLKARAGRWPTRKARNAAQWLGIELTGYSEQVSGTMIDWADIVLYMDGGNEKRLRELLMQEYGTHHQKVWDKKCRLLATYGSLRRLPDPNYTSDPEKLREYFGQLEMCTMKFLEAHPA